MENLLMSFRVVAPLIFYMCVGLLLRKTGLVGDAGFRGANRIVFYAALPALCFRSVASCDLEAMTETPYLIYIALSILLVFALALLLVPRFCRDDARRGVLILGVFRPNEAIFGLSVATLLLGEDHLTYMTLAVSLSVPLCNLLSVIVMERYRGGKPGLGRLLLQILKNPILIGCLAGFIANLAGLRLPDLLETPLKNIASITTPLAFIALGGTLSFRSLSKNRVPIAVVTLLRLVVVPAALVSAFILLGFRGEPLVAALVLFGAPTAMVVYNMAASMGADDELAASLVASTSIFSVVTMFLFLYAFRVLGLY